MLFIDHCSLTVATGRCGVVRKLRGGLMCEARGLTAEMWRSFFNLAWFAVFEVVCTVYLP